MSEPAAGKSVRMITFEVGGEFYALPIADVLEVAEIGTVRCVPTLPARIGGVVNHHGDALPVVHPAALLEMDGDVLPEPEHALVLGRDTDEAAARMAFPVDRVIGLVDGQARGPVAPGVAVEQQPIGGRLANVLDAGWLIARAVQLVERSVGHPDPGVGGE